MRSKKKVQTGRQETHADVSNPPSDNSVPDFPTEQTIPQNTAEPVRIKTREYVRRSPPMEHHRPDLPKSEPIQIKTKAVCSQRQAAITPTHESGITNAIQPEHQASHSPESGRQKFVRERVQNVSVRRTPEQRQSSPVLSTPTQELRYHSTRGQATTPITSTSAAPASLSESDQQHPKPLEQGRQKFVQERQKEAAVQRRKKQRRPERTAPTQQLGGENVQSGRISTPSVQEKVRPTENAVQETISNGKRQIKEARTGRKAVGRASRQSVKAVDSSKRTAQVGKHSAQKIQQTARAAVQARQRAVQAAGAASRAVRVVDKPVIKAAASALHGAVSAIRGMLAPLAAGGGVVIAVVLVLCLVGALLMSPLSKTISLQRQIFQVICTSPRPTRILSISASTTVSLSSMSILSQSFIYPLMVSMFRFPYISADI